MAVVARTCPLTSLPWVSRRTGTCWSLGRTSPSFSWASPALARPSTHATSSGTSPPLGNRNMDLCPVSQSVVVVAVAAAVVVAVATAVVVAAAVAVDLGVCACVCV